jgi:hypothetical protein
MAEAAERHAIQSEMAAKKPRRSSRIETKETLAYRADFRRRWIERFGPVVGPAIVIAPEMLDPEMKKAARRAYNRAWMRRNRAEKAA